MDSPCVRLTRCCMELLPLLEPSTALSNVPRHLPFQEWSPIPHAWCLPGTLTICCAVSPQLCSPLRLPSHLCSRRIFLPSARRSPCLSEFERGSGEFPWHPKYSSVPILWLLSPCRKLAEPCLHASPRTSSIFRGVVYGEGQCKLKGWDSWIET